MFARPRNWPSHQYRRSVGKARYGNSDELRLTSDVYDPMTGKGYNPLVSSLPWKGCLEKLKLKDHQRTLTTQGIMTFDGMQVRHSSLQLKCHRLTDIRDAGLQLVVLLDM